MFEVKSSRRNEIPRNGSKSVTIPNQHVSELDHCNGMDRTARTLYGQGRHAHQSVDTRVVVATRVLFAWLVPHKIWLVESTWISRLAPAQFLNRSFRLVRAP